jgi:Tfp pilus assembly protein FimT
MSDTLDRRRVTGAAEAVYSQLQFARSEAIKSGRDIKLSYTAGANWCSGMREDDGTTCDCTQTDQTQADACAILGDGSTRVLKVINASGYDSIQMSSAPATIEFDSVRGTLNGSAGTVAIASSKSNRQVNIVVSILGRVRMCSPAANHVGSYPTC